MRPARELTACSSYALAVLLMHYHAAEVYLYEIGFHGMSLSAEHGTGDSWRLETLLCCLKSATSYFDLYRGLPRSHYAYFPFTIWAQSGLVLLTAVKLATFEHGAWDLAYVRSLLDVFGIIDHEIECIEEVILQRPGSEGAVGDRDIFNGFLDRMRKLKTAYESRNTARTMLAGADTIDLNDQASGYPSDFNPAFWDALGDDVDWMINGIS